MTGHASRDKMLQHPAHRIAKWIISFAAIGIILLSALYLLRSVVVAPSIQRYLANWIEVQLGLRVDIGNIGGSYITEFVVTNVTTLKPAPAGPLVALELRRLRMTYHLWSLFNGLNGFLADAAIELEGATLTFDLARDEKNSAFSSASESSASFFLPEQLPRIRIRDTSVVLQAADYAAAFRGIEAETRHRRPPTTSIQLRIAECSWTHPDLQSGNMPVSAEIEYSAEKMIIHGLMLGKYELAQSIQIGIQSLPETIPFAAKVDLAGGKLALDGKLDHSDLHTRIKAQHIDLARVCALYRPQQLPFSGFLSMQANIILPQLDPSGMVAEIDLQLTQGGLFGLAADDLVLHAAAKDATVHLDTLALHSGENWIQFQEVTSPIAPIFAGDLTGLIESLTGKFSLECRDLPALFSLARMDIPPTVDSIPTHRLALNGELRNGSVYLSDGGLTADEGYLRLSASRIDLPTPNRPLKDAAIQAALKIDLPDLSLISRVFAIPPMTGSLKSDVSVAGTLGTPSGKAWIEAEALSFQGMAYGDATMKASSDSRIAVVESLVLQRGQDRLIGRGRFHFANLELEDAQLEFKLADLAPYTTALWPSNWKLNDWNPQISGAAEGKVTIAGPVKNPSGTFALDVRQLELDKNPLGDATVRLRASGSRITLEAMEIHQAEDFVTLTGSFDWSSRRFENARLNLAIANVPAYAQTLLNKDLPVPLAIQGSVAVSGPLKEPQAEIAITLEQLSFHEVMISSASFQARSAGRRIEIELAEAKTAFGQAMISGYLLRGPNDTHFDLQLDQATLSSQDQMLVLDKPGQIHFSRIGHLNLKDISLSGPTGSIRLNGGLGWNGGSDLNVTISNFNSQGWFESFVTDRLSFNGLNARIHLGGTMTSPSFTVVGDLARISAGNHRMALSGRFDLSYAGERITIRQFEWHGRETQQLAITGALPVNLMGKPALMPGPLMIDAKVNFSDLNRRDFDFPENIPTGGALQGELHMTGTWDAPVGTVIFQCRGLDRPSFLKPMPPGPFDIDGLIRLGENKVAIESIQIHSPHLTFSSSGEWNGTPALSDVLQGKTRRPEGAVAIQGSLIAADLSWIADEIAGLRRVSGRLEADVMIQGQLSDPGVAATVRLTDGELRPDMDVPSIQMLHLEAVASPTEVQIQECTGELGGAAFHITGSVRRDREIGVSADLRLRGDNLLLYRAEGLRLRADTDLALKGPLARLALTGEMKITDGRLVKYFDLLSTLRESSGPKTDTGLQLFSLRRPPLRDMLLDVKITSKNSFEIRNNLTKGALRPDLKLSGTGEVPILSGKVYVDPTALILPAGRLVFESGIIRFDPDHPDRPTLDLIGTTRILGYDITALVEGPYDDPVVTLSSVPPLSNEELLLLVIAGKRPEQSAGSITSQGQSVNIAVYVGRDLISRWFGMDALEAGEPILDRFEVETGKAVSRSGDETIDARFRVTEGFLRDGDTLYITGEKDVFDFYNAGLRIVFRFK